MTARQSSRDSRCALVGSSVVIGARHGVLARTRRGGVAGPWRSGAFFAGVLFAALCAVPAQDAAVASKASAKAETANAVYHFLVAAESSDEVYKLAFDGKKLRTTKVITVGYQPTEVEGPHGLCVSLDAKHWYVSIAHGKPFGLLYKYDAATDKLVGQCELGMFPATMQISPSTGLLYCVNFNLHGRMIPSTISVVEPGEMIEVARVKTGPMPHGSRLSPDGRKHYSCAMMAGLLFEVDAVDLKVVRDLQLDKVKPKNHDSETKPTWVHAHPTKRKIYVCLNGKAQVAEIDLDAWKIARRFKTPKGPYNCEVTPDGKLLVVTYKGAQSIGVWDLVSGKEVKRLPSKRRITHGVVISPDSRYAFVSSEGIGADKGGVDVVDLRKLAVVASTEIGLQAGGIAFWKTVPAHIAARRARKAARKDKAPASKRRRQGDR